VGSAITGLGNTIIDPDEELGPSEGDVCRRERLGGLLRYRGDSNCHW
jgi:hypothetical protein